MKIAKISVELIDHMGSDLSVVNAARVSFAKESDWDFDLNHDGRVNERLSEKDQKLISYLAKHNHWSPFAHTSLQFRVKAPIFVARQLVKHQVGGVWNEVSRRYVDDEPEFWLPTVWRGKPINAKQGSNGEISNQVGWTYEAKCAIADALVLYEEALMSDMAPEQARMFLPQNTMTEWIWTGSLMFFARVVKERTGAGAQLETREVAEKIANLIPGDFKYSWEALVKV